MSVYFIRNTGTQAVKIGWSKHPPTRLRNLQTNNEHRLVLECSVTTDREGEARLHAHFGDEHVFGEWFRGPHVEAFIETLQWCAASGLVVLEILEITKELRASSSAKLQWLLADEEHGRTFQLLQRHLDRNDFEVLRWRGLGNPPVGNSFVYDRRECGVA